MLASTHARTTAADAPVNYTVILQTVRAAATFNIFPSPPLGDSRFARCLQVGGVFVRGVGGSTVTISSCTISGNIASVRAHLQKFPSPDGKIADVLASTHARTTAADAPVNYTVILQNVRAAATFNIFPSPPLGNSRFARCC